MLPLPKTPCNGITGEKMSSFEVSAIFSSCIVGIVAVLGVFSVRPDWIQPKAAVEREGKSARSFPIGQCCIFLNDVNHEKLSEIFPSVFPKNFRPGDIVHVK